MNKLQVEIGKIQHTRMARRIEQVLSEKKGISYISISTSGVMQVEWDSNQTNQSEIIKSIKKLGLNIVNVKNKKEQTQAPTYLWRIAKIR